MDTQRKPRSQVQIELYWGQTPLDVISVPEKNGVVLAGSARSCEIALPEDLLPSPDFPLLTIKDGGINREQGLVTDTLLHLPERFTKRIFIPAD